jgi:hypothetical protein
LLGVGVEFAFETFLTHDGGKFIILIVMGVLLDVMFIFFEMKSNLYFAINLVVSMKQKNGFNKPP